MKLTSVTVRNFRSYREESTLAVGNLTALIGRNDVGKSTVLEALSIFFDETKLDPGDACVHGDPQDIAIRCTFSNLPDQIVIDSANLTTLQSEYLLNKHGQLEVERIWNGTAKSPTAKTYIRAVHPSAEGAGDLLKLKNSELKTRAKTLGADLSKCNQTRNAELRSAIREHVGDLQVIETTIETESQPGAKEIYSQLKQEMPAYFLFRADRPSTDQDSEAQDPMRAAVKLAVESEIQQLDAVASSVKAKVQSIVQATLEKIEQMSPEFASSLSAEIIDPRWDSIFKITLRDADNVPLNKRGSGARRLVLLGFLQAQAEAVVAGRRTSDVIYAIEEPETSQHPDNQRIIVESLYNIAQQSNSQVLITTHNPGVGRLLSTADVRFLCNDGSSSRIQDDKESVLKQAVRALGILPDHAVRVFVGVEGKHDMEFLRRISKVVARDDLGVIPIETLEAEGRLILIPFGGSNIQLWASRLENLEIPEIHIMDRDCEPPLAPKYGSTAQEMNLRENCEAYTTSVREMENYLHSDAILLANPECSISIDPFTDVPLECARKLHEASESCKSWDELDEEHRRKKASKAKVWLNQAAVDNMSSALLKASDPDGDITRWLVRITELARQ